MTTARKFYFLLDTKTTRYLEDNSAILAKLAEEHVTPVFISNIKELSPSEEDFMFIVIPQPIPDEDLLSWGNFLTKNLWANTRAYIVEQENFEKYIANDNLLFRICKAIRDLRRLNAEPH